MKRGFETDSWVEASDLSRRRTSRSRASNRRRNRMRFSAGPRARRARRGRHHLPSLDFQGRNSLHAERRLARSSFAILSFACVAEVRLAASMKYLQARFARRPALKRGFQAFHRRTASLRAPPTEVEGFHPNIPTSKRTGRAHQSESTRKSFGNRPLSRLACPAFPFIRVSRYQ